MEVLEKTIAPIGGKDLQGIAVHALHKSATMFLFKFFKYVSEQRGFAYHSANNDPPNELDSITAASRSDLQFCCCPVRTFETEDGFASEARIFRVFQVRDPRDLLVSEYFSFGWAHPTAGSNLDQRRLEIQQMSVDDYVLNQPEFSSRPLEEKFTPLLERNLNPESDVLVKYETMVTRFSEWVLDVIQPFEFRMPRVATAKLVWKYRNEFKPGGKGTHKRSIKPGDFRNQLKPQTIAVLNDRFSEILDKLNYER